jgi:alpha-1,6-mannosyltransferase
VTPTPPRRLWIPGAALCLALLPIPFLGDLRPHAAALLACWLAAHAAYLVAARVVLRRREEPSSAPDRAPGGSAPARRPDPRSLGVILGLGLLARLVTIPATPTLSEDVYRYLWDGRLTASGVNPFPHAPADPALARFHDGLLRRLNHADVPTIYPPAAQILFAVAALARPDPLSWKILLLILETLTLAALAALLRRRGLSAERLLLYYWNPLVIVESFGSGHVDLAAAAFLLAALALAEGGRRALAGALFALAVGAKYVPALLAPYWLRRRAMRLLLVSAAVLAVLFLPFAPAGASLFTGLLTYSRNWEWNGLVFSLLRSAGLSGETARIGLLAALLAAVLAASLRARTASGAALASFTALALLSPTLFPWYLVPIAALLPLHPDAGLLLLTGLVPLSYAGLPEYAASGVWRLPGWVPWVEYGGLAAAWIAAAWLRRPRGGARQRREDAWSSESPPTYRKPTR